MYGGHERNPTGDWKSQLRAPPKDDRPTTEVRPSPTLPLIT